jgi:pullulanase/glycogen debranching enzyme
LRQSVYRHGGEMAATGRADIEWFNTEGAAIRPEQWPDIESLGILLSRAENDPDSGVELAVVILFNVDRNDCDFVLPAIDAAGRWTCRYSTAGGNRQSIQARSFRAAGFSIACLTYAPL